MKKLIPFALLCICIVIQTVGQVNTFSECYFTYEQTNNNTDYVEILHDAIIDDNGDYLVFGKQRNESVFPLHSKSHILHHDRLDANGVSTGNVEFVRNVQGSKIYIDEVNHSTLNNPICGQVNWLLSNERVNSKTDVVAYSMDNSHSFISNTITLTDLNSQSDYFCRDFIQNSNNDIIWVGSEKTTGTEDIIVNTFTQNCKTSTQRRFQVFDPIKKTPLTSKARSIIELEGSFGNGIAYAVTGEAGKYAFCLLLDLAFNPVNGQIHLFKVNLANTNLDSGIKIKQLPNLNLVILGNSHALSTTGLNEFFLMELDFPNLNVVWSSLYKKYICNNARDFEINSKGDYIVVGMNDFDCAGTNSGPFLQPGWAFMTEIDGNSGDVNWAYRHHLNNDFFASPFGSSFQKVEIIQSGEHKDEIFAAGNCWERVEGAISDDNGGGGEELSNVQYQTNNDYFVVKTDNKGKLLDNPTCFEAIDISKTQVAPKHYVDKPLPKDFMNFEDFTESVVTNLEVESDFCDQTDECCQGDFDQLFNQLAGHTVSGCQFVTVNLNAVGPCWQVTWDWGDGTTTGPMPATTGPVSHTYLQGGNGYYISYYIEEIDQQGNVCNSGTSDLQVSLYFPPCECEECPGSGMPGDELIVNGGFSNGYIGFTSDFNNAACSAAGRSSVQNNISVNQCNPDWCATGATGAFTPASNDLFLIGDAFVGHPTQADVLWEQTINNIDQNTIYTFCGLFKNLLISDNVANFNPVITIVVNNQILTSFYTVTHTFCETSNPWNCDWHELNYLWNSGMDTDATIQIYLHRAQCNNCFVYGADLAVEDLSFKKCSVPTNEGKVANNDTSYEDFDVAINNTQKPSLLDVDEMKVFPNPTSSLINIEFANDQNRTLYLLSLTGQKLATKTISDRNSFLDMSDIKSGAYLIMTENLTTGKRTTKMITKIN